MAVQKVQVVCPKCKNPRLVHPTTRDKIRSGEISGWCLTCYQEQETAKRREKAASGRPICVHCSKNVANRPRGLCWTCYYTPGVKELHPSTSKYARRGVGNFAGAAPLAASPTDALPGTPEKLAVMQQRARLKQQIFHPLDAKRPVADSATPDLRPPDPCEYDLEECA